MKRFFALALILVPALALAAGTVTQTITQIDKYTRVVKFICTGDASDGTIPDTTMADNDSDGNVLMGAVRGWSLIRVRAYRTAGGTSPDAGDVFILDNGEDLLGSEDGGTTAYAGLTLIHPTKTLSTYPNCYTPRAGEHLNDYPRLTAAWILRVSNQATASANYTIELWFAF